MEYYYPLLQGNSALLQTSVSDFGQVQKHLATSRSAYSAIAITADSSRAYITSVVEQGEDNQISSLLSVSLADFSSSNVAQENGYGWQGVALGRGDSTAYVVGNNPTGFHYQSQLEAISLPAGARQEVATDSPDVCAIVVNAAGTTLFAIQCESQLLSLEL